MKLIEMPHRPCGFHNFLFEPLHRVARTASEHITTDHRVTAPFASCQQVLLSLCKNPRDRLAIYRTASLNQLFLGQQIDVFIDATDVKSAMLRN